MFDLLPGSAAADDDRDEGQAGGECRHQDRCQPFLCAALNEFGSERHAFDVLEVAIVAHEHNAVSGGDAEHGDKPHQ